VKVSAASLTLALIGLSAVIDLSAGNTPHVNYMLHCMGCHLEDGAGAPGKVPPLNNEMGKFLHVEGGREFIVQVPGVAQAALSDQDLADVLNWMLEEFSRAEIPEDFRPYSAEEIAVYRRHKLVDVTGTRNTLIAAMPEHLPPPRR